jgi:hypothetical protein
VQQRPSATRWPLTATRSRTRALLLPLLPLLPLHPLLLQRAAPLHLLLLRRRRHARRAPERVLAQRRWQ